MSSQLVLMVEPMATYLTPPTLMRLFMEYIITQIRQRLNFAIMGNINTNKNGFLDKLEQSRLLKIIMDKSNYQLRMYGSPEELAEQLNIFMDFPESYRFFEFELASAYTNTPMIYESLKNEKFICKSDLFVMLQDIALKNFAPMRGDLNRRMLVMLLKIEERKLQSKVEFVRYDPSVFEEIEREIEAMVKIIKDSSIRVNCRFPVPMSLPQNCTADEAFARWKRLLKVNLDDAEYGNTHTLLQTIVQELPNGEHQTQILNWLLYICELIVKTFRAIIEKRPELFKLREEVKPEKAPPLTVRLFDDGGQLFLMESELLHTIRPDTHFSGELYRAPDYTDAQRKYGLFTYNIEFIKVPILRTKHKTVPIRIPNSEKFCILAVDALFDLFKHLFFGAKIFQRASYATWDVVEFFRKMEPMFNPEIPTRYFITTSAIQKAEQMIFEEFAKFDSLPAKDVRNAKSDGFTVQNLKNELAHLELTVAFPEIQNHAEVVYAHVDSVKKEKVLRTCDLFDAVEYCQLICIFNRVPKLRNFLHNQKSCGKVLTIQCGTCEGAVPVPPPIQAPPSIQTPPLITDGLLKVTKYLDHCESIRTPMSLHSVALSYILEEYRSNPNLQLIEYPADLVKNNGEELIQLLFDKSIIKMRMYGSAKELAENIKIFKNFPGSDHHFDILNDPYYSTPIIFDSLSNRRFIHKSDLFVMLQSMVKRSLPEGEPFMILGFVSIYLKSQEKRVSEHVEFVPFERKVIDQIWKEISIDFKKDVEERAKEDLSLRTLIQGIAKSKADQLLQKIKKYLPIEPEDDERILLMMQQYNRQLESFGSDNALVLVAWAFAETKTLIKRLEGVVKKRPEMFLARFETEKKLPITVRVFEDGDRKFVMKTELFKAIKIQNDYTDIPDMFDTMSWETVLQKYKSKLKSIEFIRYPIVRAKHRAVPVNAPDTGRHCCLAVDVLFDFMKYLIFELQIFQICASPDWNGWEGMFKGLELSFMPDKKDPYFLRRQHKITAEMSNPSPAKTIRNAKKDGFTVQNLKNELVYLGLTVTFPEIQDHAEVVYAHVDEVKKEKVLRTCDLIDALEYCQLICVFERLPKYKIFLHNQGGCRRVPGLKCDLCTSIGSAAPTVPEPSKSTESENSQKVDNLAETLKQLMSSSGSKEVPGKSEIPPLIENSKSNDQKSDAPPPSQAPPIPAPKESKNCQKCYRTCEMLNETKKELTRNEQKMKKLEKKLGEIKGENTKEIEKKDREMEEFNRRTHKIVQENVGFKEKIEELEMEKKQLEKKLARQEQASNDAHLKLTEKISLLEISLKNESEKSLQLQNDLQISRQNAQTPGSWTYEKQHLEQQIGAQNQKIQEFHTENIRLKTENELNSRMVQQLMDKLAQRGGASYFDGRAHFGYPDQQYYTQSYSNPGQSTSTNFEESFEPAPIYYPPPELQYPDPPATAGPSISNSLLNELQEQWTSGSTSAEVAPTEPKVALAAQKASEPKAVPTTVTTSEVPPPPHGNPSNAPEARVLPTNQWQRVEKRSSRNSREQQHVARSPRGKPAAAASQPKSSELEDSECLICLVDVRRKHRTMKCHHCRRRFHKDCASKWVKVKSECPACRGRFLDPDEFPTLS